VATTFATSARNVRITWKVILLFWLVLMTILCLRTAAQDSSDLSVSRHAGHANHAAARIAGEDRAE
jgi:hypothetical protein